MLLRSSPGPVGITSGRLRRATGQRWSPGRVLPGGRRHSSLESTKIFIATFLSCSLVNGDFGNRYNEAAAPFPNELQLLDNFILEIPRQDDHIIWFSLTDAIRVMDGDMRSREKSSLFVRAPVNRVLNEVFADTAVMQ